MMIWHIFKKDWRLLWRYAASLAALHVTLMTALLRLGRFRGAPVFDWVDRYGGVGIGEDRTLVALYKVFPMLTSLACAFLITAIVHQDTIPGVRQDWLVRPIRRRDLLLAKLLGLLIMVLAPIFAADLSGALLNGFPMGQAITAALSRSLWLFFLPFLPVFALASLTKNAMEAIVGGTAAAGVFFLVRLWRVPGPDVFLMHRSVDWIDQVVRLGIVLIAAAALLGLQYYFRKTKTARLLTVGVVLLFLLVPTVPWQTAFALEERLSPSPGAGNSVGLSFVPDREALGDRPVGPMRYDSRSDAFILLPVRATGMPNEAVLIGDASKVRLSMPDGKIEALGYQMGFQISKEEPGEGEKPISYVIRVPRSLNARIADQSVRVEIDYFLTLLRVVGAENLPATGGDQRTQSLGWCGTRISDSGGEVLLGCVLAGPAPTCASVVLEHIPSGARNRRSGICRPDYSPFRRGIGPDAMVRFTEALPFGNPAGIDTYPVKEPMLPQSQVKVRMYEAMDHFMRQLAIPNVRLREWASSE